jgi:hypothetical protein
MLIVHKIEEGPRERIVDSLRFSDRELIRVPIVLHTDFTGYPEYSRLWPRATMDSDARAHRSPEDALRMYAAITNYIGCYLDAILARGEPSASRCQPIPGGAVEKLSAVKGPTEEELYTEMHDHGVESAVRMFARAGGTSGYSGQLRRAVMMRIANELGYAGRSRDEAEYSQLMTYVYPDADAFEHAGDTWANAKEPVPARAAYERALALDPSRPGIKEKMAALGVGVDSK